MPKTEYIPSTVFNWKIPMHFLAITFFLGLCLCIMINISEVHDDNRKLKIEIKKLREDVDELKKLSSYR